MYYHLSRETCTGAGVPLFCIPPNAIPMINSPNTIAVSGAATIEHTRSVTPCVTSSFVMAMIPIIADATNSGIVIPINHPVQAAIAKIIQPAFACLLMLWLFFSFADRELNPTRGNELLLIDGQ